MIEEKTFTADSGHLKYLRPVVKMSALFAGLPLSFDVPEDIANLADELADTMDRIGDAIPDNYDTDVRAPNLHLMRQFLEAIDLVPEARGMGLGKSGNYWYWMSEGELKQHQRTAAVIPNFPR